MNPPDSQWEARVRQTARAFAYPPTPTLRPIQPTRAHSHFRLAWVAVLLALLIGSVIAVPPLRAAVLDFLRVGAIRIFVTEPTATPLNPTPTPRHWLGTLAGATMLTEARARVAFPIPLPTYPADLGAPDRVFVQFDDGLVVLVWLDDQQPDQVRLALYLVTDQWWGAKSPPRVVRQTFVSGRYAVWAEGEHLLQFGRGGSDNVDFAHLVTGNVLIWTDDAVTYRLETNDSLEEAIRIAESLH